MNGSEQIQKIADTYTNGRDAPIPVVRQLAPGPQGFDPKDIPARALGD